MQHSPGIPRGFHKIPIIFAAAIALALSVAWAGPAGASSWGPRSWTVQVGSESWDQEIQGMAFLPTDITVNEEDSITWEANSAEIHTVTFLASGQSLEPFNPGAPDQLNKRGGSWYDGQSYYNSGLLANVHVPGFPTVKSYKLKFPHEGHFTYYCLVHGMAMKGTVHVQQRGSAYPHTQRDYDRSSAVQEEAILKDGMKLDDALAKHASSRKVFAGDDDGIAMVMRFVQPTVRVHVGDTVHFINPGMGAPHTVTFGDEPADIFAPSGDPKDYRGGDLNSGIIPADAGPHSTFDVTFKTAGTFRYICALHDYMGMVGKVIVVD
ncbi:plastocyanin/azurin family copper-binding protein [Arthrobacter sp. B1I2]|uniref:plastocyanin/azurin family copper-binding protein n=1 Tax=Arthrobacter sp. B1I2 TaxID=3042263 RepID=UPI0027834A6E|nr:plastocyanin/azurin family copper-binding protein [Arthrobacter sp. B1I2]MDQ0731153.1 plastocyanin [Arthrobacter sp. B1I2]